MADDLNAIAEIDGCGFLFLIDLREPGHNTLHVQVAEGRPVGPPKSVKVANTEISDCTAIEITDESRVFEIIWKSYVGYSVLNRRKRGACARRRRHRAGRVGAEQKRYGSRRIRRGPLQCEENAVVENRSLVDGGAGAGGGGRLPATGSRRAALEDQSRRAAVAFDLPSFF